METRDALMRAREAGLDLVEVAPQSKPPVCRIMDYGKWKYAQKKKERKATTHKETELKEVKIRTPRIGAHDLGIKVEHARAFLERGDRVQFTLQFRGREMAHQDIGRGILQSIKAQLGDLAKVERDMGMEGRFLSMLVAPSGKTAAKQAAKSGAAKSKPKPPRKPADGEGAPVASAPADQAPPAQEAPAVQDDPVTPTVAQTQSPESSVS